MVLIPSQSSTPQSDSRMAVPSWRPPELDRRGRRPFSPGSSQRRPVAAIVRPGSDGGASPGIVPARTRRSHVNDFDPTRVVRRQASGVGRRGVASALNFARRLDARLGRLRECSGPGGGQAGSHSGRAGKSLPRQFQGPAREVEGPDLRSALSVRQRSGSSVVGPRHGEIRGQPQFFISPFPLYHPANRGWFHERPKESRFHSD